MSIKYKISRYVSLLLPKRSLHSFELMLTFVALIATASATTVAATDADFINKNL